jgi:hypothetical protein
VTEPDGILDAEAIAVTVINRPAIAAPLFSKDLIGQAMEGADSGARLADETEKTLVHLISSLAAEGDGEDPARINATYLHEVANAIDQGVSFTATGHGGNEEGTFIVTDDGFLLRVETFEQDFLDVLGGDRHGDGASGDDVA